MAKNNNLKDFLTDVADAIRSKTGEAGLINPQDFSARIASIQTGGGGGDTPTPSPTPSVSKGDVTFYDYDGVVLHSYSKDAFLALSAMPELPTRSGLICQGWNWPFAEAQAYVAEYGKANIGVNYITDDEKTRLYISVPKGNKTVTIQFYQTKAKGVIIDWGDGSNAETSISSAAVGSYTHSYGKDGDYVISLDVNSDCIMRFGSNSSSGGIMGSSADTNAACRNMLRKVEMGARVDGLRAYSFYYCSSLESISVTTSVSTTRNYSFYYCYSLKSISIPYGVSDIETNAFSYCYSLESVCPPYGVANVGGFLECRNLKDIVIPNSVTRILAGAFNKCYSLKSALIPNNVASIESNAFAYSLISDIVLPANLTSIADGLFDSCYQLTSVTVKGTISSIGSRAFYSCRCVGFYDFSSSSSIPTLSNTNAFYYMPSNCKIIVPDALYDEWIAATNWSSYASYIIKDSEYIR